MNEERVYPTCTYYMRVGHLLVAFLSSTDVSSTFGRDRSSMSTVLLEFDILLHTLTDSCFVCVCACIHIVCICSVSVLWIHGCSTCGDE